MRTILALLLLLPAGTAALLVPSSAPRSRRAALGALAALPALAAAPPAADAILTPLALMLQKQKADAQACYDAEECAEAVPYYSIQCDRTDDACLARRQRLARRALATGDLGGPAGILALLLLPGPIALLARFTRRLLERP
jgi:hypothetical protein